MRSWWVYSLMLLVGVGGLALRPPSSSGQNAATPREGSWAMSGSETPSKPPAVIASTKSTATVIQAEARTPLPDDGLAPPPPQPGLLPPMPARPGATAVQHAIYVPANDARAQQPIQQVAAAPVEGSTPPRPAESMLAIQIHGPTSATPGQVLPCYLVVRNAAGVALSGVTIELPVPPGVRILNTKPEAERDDNRLSWRLGNLEAGAERRLDLEAQISQPADLSLTPSVRFTAAMGLRTAVVRPPFSVSVQAPETAAVGEKVVFQLQVGNHTQEPIRRISLHCELSQGLLHPQGQIIEADLPEDLPPGQIRTIPLEAQARQAGRHTAVVQATAEGNRSASVTASLVVSEPSMALTLQGPRKATVGQEVQVQLEVANPARKPCARLRVTQNLPQGVEFVSASTQGNYNPITQTVSWEVPEMLAEQRQTLSVRLRARQAGDWAMAANLQVEGATPTRATHALQVEATPALAMELTAQEDPIGVGRDTVYEVRVYNAGSAAASGLRLVMRVPEPLAAVSAEGPTSWQIRGQQVYFEPLAEMRERRDAIYRVRVRGMKAGEGRFQVELHANGLARPLEQGRTSHVQAVAR